MESSNKGKYTLQSVDNALKIIDLLTVHTELTAAETAGLLGISKSAAFRLLATLEEAHFVVRHHSSQYRLGVKLAAIGQAVTDRMDIIQHVHPYLEELARRTRETAYLVVWHGESDVLFLDKARSRDPYSFDVAVGASIPAHRTATGKALLACAPESFLQKYLQNTTFQRSTQHSIYNQEELLLNLQEVRQLGYAINAEEDAVGLTSYAVALTGSAGRGLAAVSIAGPTERMCENQEANIEVLLDVRDRLNDTLR